MDLINFIRHVNHTDPLEYNISKWIEKMTIRK